MAVTDSPVQARAKAKYVRSTPRKAQLVAEQIRGLPVPEARTVLAFSKRAAAKDVEKVLLSAIANAEANHDLIGDELFVQEIYVGQGPTLKRWRARARGRTGRILKRTCHIVVGLAELDEELRALYASDEPIDAAAELPEDADLEVAADDADSAVDEDVAQGEADESEAAVEPDESDEEADESEAPEPDAEAADDEVPVSGEPYEGYGDHTAKQVIALVGELTDEQLDAITAQDERVTVSRAIEKERKRRSEAETEEQES